MSRDVDLEPGDSFEKFPTKIARNLKAIVLEAYSFSGPSSGIKALSQCHYLSHLQALLGSARGSRAFLRFRLWLYRVLVLFKASLSSGLEFELKPKPGLGCVILPSKLYLH